MLTSHKVNLGLIDQKEKYECNSTQQRRLKRKLDSSKKISTKSHLTTIDRFFVHLDVDLRWREK